jgi:hypothetical protein
MSVKDDILQRIRAERMHARGRQRQARPTPVTKDALFLPENEEQLRQSMRPPTGIDVDAAYAKWNEDWLARKRRLAAARNAVASEAPEEPAAAEAAPATTPARFDSEAIYARRNRPRG